MSIDDKQPHYTAKLGEWIQMRRLLRRASGGLRAKG